MKKTALIVLLALGLGLAFGPLAQAARQWSTQTAPGTGLLRQPVSDTPAEPTPDQTHPFLMVGSCSSSPFLADQPVETDTAGTAVPRPGSSSLPWRGAGLAVLLAASFLLFALSRRIPWQWRRLSLAPALAGLLLAGALGLSAHMLVTAKGKAVAHTHPREGLTPARKKLLEDVVTGLIPGKKTLVNPPTTTYNCHSKTFDAGGSWLPDPTDIIADGYMPVPAGGARVGDIVVYTHMGMITHTGIVTGVDSNGNVTEVCSKWGEMGEYRHAPGDTLQGQKGMVGGQMVMVATYGTPTVYRAKA